MDYSAQEIKRHYALLALICLGFVITSALLQHYNGISWASMGKTPIQDGEYWRLLTGHLIHMNWHHYVMNMIGLALCMVVFRDDLPSWHWLTSFVFIALFSSACMFFTYFSYERYLGFSDVLHGWIILGALSIAHKEPKLSAAIFILFWIKVLEENMQHPFFTSYNMTGNVATESHIYGAIGGVIYALLFSSNLHLALKKLRQSK